MPLQDIQDDLLNDSKLNRDEACYGHPLILEITMVKNA
jgi:hypothetical protein